MPKYNVTIKGTLYFEKTIPVYTANANKDEAEAIATEILMEQHEKGNEIYINECIAQEAEKTTYEIMMKVKHE